MKLPPLSLYIHIPWCVQKCPYCDFNSHHLKEALPHQQYVQHLLADLQQELVWIADRPIHTVFIGGGTPSLLSAPAMTQLLQGVAEQLQLLPDAEITMEANPGTVESARFSAYQQAGINRISLGIQSFDNQQLQRLGRIHNAQDAIAASQLTQQLSLRSFNLDLMHGLPQQTVAGALADLEQAIALAPPHLSWYQLTIEPHTQFASRPPVLPDDDQLWEIFCQGKQLLEQAGYQQYETSAYAKPGYQCQHNLNYWRFGDYLGIGCGAHGKITLPDGQIIRRQKVRHPKGYLQGHYLDKQQPVPLAERPFEFFMNRFRLLEPIPQQQFIDYTGLPLSSITPQINQLAEQGYLTITTDSWQVTEKGQLFANDLMTAFLEN